MGARGAASTKDVVGPSLCKPESRLPAISTKGRLIPVDRATGISGYPVEMLRGLRYLCQHGGAVAVRRRRQAARLWRSVWGGRHAGRPGGQAGLFATVFTVLPGSRRRRSPPPAASLSGCRAISSCWAMRCRACRHRRPSVQSTARASRRPVTRPVRHPENLKKGKGVENVSTSVPRLTPSRMSLGFAPAHPVGGVPLQAQGRLGCPARW